MTDREPLSASESVSSSRATNTSDDSEGIITNSKTGVNRRGVAPQVATMSGALADEDVGEKKLKPLSSRRRVALSRIAREADHTKVVQALKARRDAALAAEKAAREGKQPEVQVRSTQPVEVRIPTSSSSPTPSHAPVGLLHPPREIHVNRPRAPPARETSILAIENFKLRPRQPSLLQIAQAHTAARDSEFDDTFDEFNPDDESTPLHQSKNGLQHGPSSASSSRQSSSRKRKLSSPEIQVPSSQPPFSSHRSSSPGPSLPDNPFDIFADDSQPNPPLPPIPASKLPSAGRQTIDSNTLAPPQSSSPLNQPQQENRQAKARSKRPQTASKPKGKATNTKSRKNLSTLLPPRSPSPTQSSPTAVPKSRSPLKPITTSALQNLLPRRRRVMSRNKENIFELNSSSDLDTFNAGEMDEDQDELSYHATARNHAGRPGTAKRKNKTGAGKSKKSKPVANGAASKPKGGKRPSATYTRKQNLEPDENEDASTGGEDYGAGETLVTDGKAKAEMKKLAAKFREVDDWGLEFEEVTGSSDRMRDAR
ncbi:MAG: hypothetical protein Q9196_000530 [Gyalolechia fulgens]